METDPSCIASSKADCVLGGVRLISSARMIFAKIGPFTKTRVRFPVARSSSMISVPVISAGIKSGVNWIRLKSRCRTCATVEISSVFARPGTPVMMEWPPVSIEIITWSTTSFWPTMIFRIS